MSVSLNNVSQVNNTQSIKQSEKTTDEKPKSSTLTKTTVAIGAGLTALAAIGIYFATRGRGIKATEKVVAETVKGATQTAQESANTIKKYSVEAFKKAGNKFNKGKALNADGTGFSGTISTQTKNGSSVFLEYEKGLLSKSTKIKDNDIIEKTYKYNKDGSLSINIKSKDTYFHTINIDSNKGLLYQNRMDSFIVKDLKTGKVLKENGTLFVYDKNCNLIGGQDTHGRINTYYPNGKIKLKSEGNTVKFFDENGNILTVSNGKKITNEDMQYKKERQKILDAYMDARYQISLCLGKGKHYMD